jgi:hypothetical protein
MHQEKGTQMFHWKSSREEATHKCTWENNIKTEQKEIGCEDMTTGLIPVVGF